MPTPCTGRRRRANGPASSRFSRSWPERSSLPKGGARGVPGRRGTGRRCPLDRPISMGGDGQGQGGEGKREVGPGDGDAAEGAGADVGSEGSGEEQDEPDRGGNPEEPHG